MNRKGNTGLLVAAILVGVVLSFAVMNTNLFSITGLQSIDTSWFTATEEERWLDAKADHNQATKEILQKCDLREGEDAINDVRSYVFWFGKGVEELKQDRDNPTAFANAQQDTVDTLQNVRSRAKYSIQKLKERRDVTWSSDCNGVTDEMLNRLDVTDVLTVELFNDVADRIEDGDKPPRPTDTPTGGAGSGSPGFVATIISWFSGVLQFLGLG